MRTIGLIGGMSWESTAVYYRLINEEVNRRLGGQHNAKSLMATLDFAEIEACQAEGRWDDAGALLASTATTLVGGGAEIMILCTNTMHKVADYVSNAASAEFIHIADPTAAAIQREMLSTVGLLGTRYTMEQDFYRGRLEASGLTVLVPDPARRERVHEIIYDELCLGKVLEDSRREYQSVVQSLQARGATGVILGCTEIGLLLKPEDVAIPLFDTTRLHALAAVDAALR
ncbi:aspartate/glutamate racemase family protein [Dyella japonica]|uniref:Aspartate racemase n=1 Tax=Dyella japonica DSM 16301 TaxID=1440762 RepID=A0A0G9H5R0_9GAMM|nr:aspartate/glutamate racemase family protein [Dyella japonica]KLD64584.1 hypothetical protein Y882_06895 [Dyella japonica DSM 16301]